MPPATSTTAIVPQKKPLFIPFSFQFFSMTDSPAAGSLSVHQPKDNPLKVPAERPSVPLIKRPSLIVHKVINLSHKEIILPVGPGRCQCEPL
jgi:hypothetical protein